MSDRHGRGRSRLRAPAAALALLSTPLAQSPALAREPIILMGHSGHTSVHKGVELGLLRAGYTGPSGPLHGPDPWNYSRTYLENLNPADLLPHVTGQADVFKFSSPSAPSNRGWPVRAASRSPPSD